MGLDLRFSSALGFPYPSRDHFIRDPVRAPIRVKGLGFVGLTRLTGFIGFRDLVRVWALWGFGACRVYVFLGVWGVGIIGLFWGFRIWGL